MLSAHAFTRPGALAQALHTQYLVVLLVLCWWRWCYWLLVVLVLVGAGAGGGGGAGGGSARWQLPVPCRSSGLGSSVGSRHPAAPAKSCLPPRPGERRGEAVQCPFPPGHEEDHEEDLAVPMEQEGAGGAHVLREQRWR